MSKLLILDFQRDRVRGFVADQEGRWLDQFQIDPDGQETLTHAELEERILQETQSRNLRRAPTLILVGRDLFELQPVTLPPAPQDEWPDMLRFMASQTFASLRDEGVIDFLPLQQGTDEAGPRLLAAAMSMEDRDRLVKLAERCGVRLISVIPRPFAAVRTAADPTLGSAVEDAIWIVDADHEAAEISLAEKGRLLLTRSVRLDASQDATAWARSLSAELKRTRLAALQQSLPAPKVSVVYADPVLFESVKQLHQEAVLHPAVAVQQGNLLASLAVCGAVRDGFGDAKPLIDFLHPRQRPQPVDHRTTVQKIGLAVAAIVLVGVGAIWWQLRSMDQTTRGLRRELQQLKQDVKETTKFERQLGDVERWTNGNINWLAELHELSQQLPTAEKIMISKIVVKSMPDGGEIDITGQVDDPATLKELEESIHGPDRVPTGFNRFALDDQSPGGYAWGFTEKLLLNTHPLETVAPVSKEVTP